MATQTEANQFRYMVPYYVWATRRASVIQRARQSARMKRKRADGDPSVHVVLEWPQDSDDQLPLEHC